MGASTPRKKVPRIAFVGEAWGIDEDAAKLPLVGASGRVFNSLLASLGLEREIIREGRHIRVKQPDSILVTNVFNIHPEGNDLKHLLGSKKEAVEGWPWRERGQYLTEELLPEVRRLWRELAAFKPDVIVALGATPLWALCRVPGGIMARRGCYHEAQVPGLPRPVPLIPTIHPAFIIRKFTWFVLAASDFQKACRFASGSLRPEAPRFVAEPTLAQVKALRRLKGPIAFDIETLPSLRAITCVGIGEAGALTCVPFVDMRRPGRNYWPSASAEREAWLAIRDTLENPKTVKITQHGLGYDSVWLREVAGIEPRGMIWDTRQLHHALWPELPHDLGAIVTSFPDVLMQPWKADHESAKKDS